MIFGLHPEAEAEFEEAVAFYEDHAEGLGLDFAAEVREAIERALAMPLAWVEIEPGIMVLRWLDAALADLRAIKAYIAEENPEAARRVLINQPTIGRAGRIGLI